jgi:hypothetical protein
VNHSIYLDFDFEHIRDKTEEGRQSHRSGKHRQKSKLDYALLIIVDHIDLFFLPLELLFDILTQLKFSTLIFVSGVG